MPLAALLEHIPLAQIWESVVLSRIALPHGLVARGAAAPLLLPSPAEDDEVVVEIVDESSTSAPAAKGQRSRRISASDLLAVKSEIGEGNTNTPKN
jgi:hypothetical protein